MALMSSSSSSNTGRGVCSAQSVIDELPSRANNGSIADIRTKMKQAAARMEKLNPPESEIGTRTSTTTTTTATKPTTTLVDSVVGSTSPKTLSSSSSSSSSKPIVSAKEDNVAEEEEGEADDVKTIVVPSSASIETDRNEATESLRSDRKDDADVIAPSDEGSHGDSVPNHDPPEINRLDVGADTVAAEVVVAVESKQQELNASLDKYETEMTSDHHSLPGAGNKSTNSSLDSKSFAEENKNVPATKTTTDNNNNYNKSIPIIEKEYGTDQSSSSQSSIDIENVTAATTMSTPQPDDTEPSNEQSNEKSVDDDLLESKRSGTGTGPSKVEYNEEESNTQEEAPKLEEQDSVIEKVTPVQEEATIGDIQEITHPSAVVADKNTSVGDSASLDENEDEIGKNGTVVTIASTGQSFGGTLEKDLKGMEEIGSSSSETGEKDQSNSTEKEASVNDDRVSSNDDTSGSIDDPSKPGTDSTNTTESMHLSEDEDPLTGTKQEDTVPTPVIGTNGKAGIESDFIDFDEIDEKDAAKTVPLEVPEEKAVVVDEVQDKNVVQAEHDENATLPSRTTEEGTESTSIDSPSTSAAKATKDNVSDKPDMVSAGNTKNEGPAPKGSLASFFEKVNQKEKDSTKKEGNIGLPATTTSGSTSSFAERVQVAEEMNVLENMQRQRQPPPQFRAKEKTVETPAAATTKKLEDYPPKEYGGSWGLELKQSRHADLDLLFLVFQDHVRKLTPGGEFYGVPRKEAIFPLGIGNDTDEDDASDASLPPIPEDILASAANILKDVESRNSAANSDFVEGLDDIDKFFEGVDPPDELDVGASGSTMQEVLMGKGREILFKRIGLGYQFLRSTASSIWNKLCGLVPANRFKDANGQWAVTPEALFEVGKGVWDAAKTGFQRLVDFIDDLIDGDDNDLDGNIADMNLDFSQLGLRDPPLGNAGQMRPPSSHEGEADPGTPGLRMGGEK
jgi:hypothetical protein